jgi:teichuronic acid biosynthesis glycosyltransferase TuaG
MISGKVSFLVVTYNAERFIRETIDSCLAQTYTDFELLVLDNASVDDTKRILGEYRKRDPRVKVYLSQDNLGAYGGLNYLLDKAEGEYIAIQDHDDVWMPEKIHRQIAYLEANPDRVGCGVRTLYYYEAYRMFVESDIVGEAPFVDHTGLVFRNQGYRYDTRYTLTDEHFEMKVLAPVEKNGTLYALPEVLAIHRVRGDGKNLSRSRFTLNQKNIREFFFLRGYNLGSLFAFLGILVFMFTSPAFVWQVVRFMKRKQRFLTEKEFNTFFPGVRV